MTTQADFDAFVQSQRGVRKLTIRDVETWWQIHGHLQGAELYRVALTDMTAMAATYGDMSAAAAADFYEAARADSVARGTFRATVGPSVAPQAVVDDLRYALDGGDTVGRLTGLVEKAALQNGREVIMRNAARDRAKPRFARVPVGKTCAFCVMLASRGPVYRSAEAAGAARKFHSHCDCQPVPSWDHGNDLPPSYDEGHLYGLYEQARVNADSGDQTKILAAMRRLDGGKHFNDGVAPSK